MSYYIKLAKKKQKERTISDRRLKIRLKSMIIRAIVMSLFSSFLFQQKRTCIVY